MTDWWRWAVLALLVLNLAVSTWAGTRPMVPVSQLTGMIYAAGGDARVLLLRVQQVEQALQQAGKEIERLREELKKTKGDGK